MTNWQQQLFEGPAEWPAWTGRPVLAFDPERWSSAQRVVDLARLGYLVEPVLDPTFGLGGMWGRHVPQRLVRSDLQWQRAVDVQADVQALPFRDRAFGSVLFDPPFKLTHDGRERDDHDVTARFDARAGQHFVLRDGIAECARVADRWLIVKCQDQTEGWKFNWQTGAVVLAAKEHGWRLYDLVHQVNSIPQPGGRAQRSARHNYSTYVVLRR